MKTVTRLFATMLSLACAFIVWSLPVTALIDGYAYDRMLRLSNADSQESDVIIIGIDDLSLERYREPLVMWHKYLAEAISRANAYGAQSIGLDLIPAVSMELINPQLDIQLMQAIRAATQQGTRIVLGFSVGQNGLMPEQKFALIANGLGFLNVYPDEDMTIRRQLASLSNQEGKTAHSLAFQMAAPLISQPAEMFNNTYIDYHLHLGKIISLADLLQLNNQQDAPTLQEMFQGKNVLIGMTSKKLQDYHKTAKIIDSGSNDHVPGVYIHAYMLQTILHGKLRKDAGYIFNFFILTILSFITSFLLLHHPPQKALLLVFGIVTVSCIALYTLFLYGTVVSMSAAVSGFFVPCIVGFVFRILHEHHLAGTMNKFFGAYVNTDRIEEILKNPQARLRKERELQKAIEKREHYLCYQPKVDIRTGSIVGFEALVRWRRANGDVVPPSEFIPMAEETGMVCNLTKLIIDMACEFAAKFANNHPQQSGNLPRISVNLSARDLEHPDLITHLIDTTKRHGISPEQIDLELTESFIIRDLHSAIEKISEIRKHGFTISIDDFGTGQSSLSYIIKIPFDTIKIDKSIIDGIVNNKLSYSVLCSIISLSKNLECKIVAEGVEDYEQLEKLTQLKCDYVQGYIYSKPLDENDAKNIFLSKIKFSII